MLSHFDRLHSIDGSSPRKKDDDPRTYLPLSRQATADRVVQVCRDLGATGRSLR